MEEVIHPEWNGEFLDGYDIALLKLDREVNSGLPSLNEPNNPPAAGTRLAALGWGKDEYDVPVDELQLASNLEFVPLKSCQRQWNGRTVKADIMMCAGLGIEDTCKGKLRHNIKQEPFSKQETLVARYLYSIGTQKTISNQKTYPVIASLE